MLKDIPQSLLQISQRVVDTQSVLESCTSCGAVVGACVHSDGIVEDVLSQEAKPNDSEPEATLSGEKEDVIINPEYKTLAPRR